MDPFAIIVGLWSQPPAVRGDAHAGAFTLEPGRCYRTVRDHVGRADHCAEPPCGMARYRSGGRWWDVDACDRTACLGVGEGADWLKHW
jgi:hypothetical protein